MARDYAKPRNPNAGRSRSSASANRRGPSSQGATNPTMPGWVWLLIGLALGGVGMAIVYIDRPSHRTVLGSAAAPSTADQKADDRKAASADDGKPAAAAKPAPDAAVPSSDKGSDKALDKVPSQFTFYNELPKIEVAIPREYSRPPPAGKTIKTPPAEVPADVKKALDEPGSYLIQVGAYKSRDEADRQRASLALIGYESRIEQVTLDERDIRFRVRIGPQPTLAAAQSVMARLEDSKIKGFLVKVKD